MSTKAIKKEQFDAVSTDSSVKVLSNKSAYKKDDNGVRYHQTVLKFKDSRGQTKTYVREIDHKGSVYYQM